MSAISRQGDQDTGHDACPPTPIISYSPNVIVNGRNVGRVGDNLASHGCPDHPTHGRTIVTGDTTVIVNDMYVAKIGSAINCGGTMAEGSPNVFAGGPLG